MVLAGICHLISISPLFPQMHETPTPPPINKLFLPCSFLINAARLLFLLLLQQQVSATCGCDRAFQGRRRTSSSCHRLNISMKKKKKNVESGAFIMTTSHLIPHSAANRPKSLLVYINPHGGRRRGERVYQQKVAPLLRRACISADVIGGSLSVARFLLTLELKMSSSGCHIGSYHRWGP